MNPKVKADKDLKHHYTIMGNKTQMQVVPNTNKCRGARLNALKEGDFVAPSDSRYTKVGFKLISVQL